MTKFKFFVVALPHVEVKKDEPKCAYTAKVYKFCQMMKSLNYEVVLLGAGETDAPCDEFVSCISKEKMNEYFGHVDTSKDFFPIEWQGTEPYWVEMNTNAVTEITKRVQPKDFICIIGGSCQQSIVQAFPHHLCVEFGVGYKGIIAPFRVFESYAWMNWVYGSLVGSGIDKDLDNGKSFDIVIPNYWDPADFPFSDKKEDYFLYVGRMISRKGVFVAAEACGELDKKLILAGQGFKKEGDRLIAPEFEVSGKHLDYVGTVDTKKRGELMSKAKAVFLLTNYHEPFGGTHIEAMFCGTPVITSDNGVFSETVSQGNNGFRTRTLGEVKQAMREVEKFTPQQYSDIRDFAVRNFSLDKVRYMYDSYFQQLSTLWEKGWKSDWNKLDRYTNYDFKI